MPRWLLLLVCAAVAGGVAGGERRATTANPAQVVAGPAAVTFTDPSDGDDPFPVRRVRATEAQLPALLKELDAGPLVRMPRTAFEAKLRSADPPDPARVTDARFEAALANGDLAGTAKLELVNPGDRPQFVPLDPMRLAVGAAKWGDGTEAVVGVPAGGTAAGVWVDRPGRQTLTLKWSAAGTTELGERRFELRVPPAPTATLDLDLPPGQVPTAGADVLLTRGPAGNRWRLRFGGRSRLDFAVRPAGDPGAAAAATLVARYEVTPGQLACRFEYDLRPAKGAVGDWVFAVDPGLRVTEVVATNRAGWGFDPPGPDGLRRLRVSLRPPAAGGKILVAAVAPFPDRDRPPTAPLPVVRPVGTVLDDETWELRLAPGLRAENWTAGDYRVTDTQVIADQTRVIALAGTLLPPGQDRPFRRPPGFRPGFTDHEFTTTEQVAWRFEADRVTAVVRVGVRVRRGPLFQLALRVPAGYGFVRASSPAADLISHAGRGPGGAVAEFARPLTTGQTAEVTFEFRGPRLAAGSHRLPFPAFAVGGAAERDGVLGVLPGPGWAAQAQPGPGAIPVGWFDFDPPAVPAGATAAFRFRGGEPDGWVTLDPVRPGAAPKDAPGPEPAPMPAPSVAHAAPVEPVRPAARVVGAPEPPRGWEFGNLDLVTAVVAPAEVVVAFGGTVTAAGGPVLPIRLPAGAELRSATVGGRWLSPGEARLAGDGVLNLPMPAAGRTRFEVRYRLPVEATGPVRRIRSPEPALPGGPAVGRWWAFGPDVLPGWPVRAWDRGTAADLPAAAADLPLAGPGVLVSRAAVEEVRVGSARGAQATGIGFAAGFLALAWAGGRRRHPFCSLLVVGGLLVAGAAVLLAPPWWQRAGAMPLVVGLVAAAAMVVARGVRAVPAAAGLAVWFALAVSDTGAQPAAPAVVVLLPADEDGREEVLAPKALLDRLNGPPTPGVILTAAGYAVTTDPMTARVVATFTAHVIGGADPVATLPLADARLERATVGGRPAFSTTSRPGVYTVPLPGPGRHEVEVAFSAPIAGTGPERELRFGVPECLATRVTVDLPGSARQPQVVGRLGAQAEAAGERVRVEADAGAVRAVVVRWRDGAGGAAAVRVREGCVWDVSEAGADLTACYLVRVEQGTVSSLRFDVPAELEPLGVTVRPLDPLGVAGLRDWTLGPEKGGFRPLRLDFQGPTAGRVLVVLACSPRAPVTRHPVLRFPRVILPGGAVNAEAAYGLRSKSSVVVEDYGRAGVIDFTADLLTRDFAAVPELRLDPNAPVRVFRPVPGAVPELRPILRPAAEPPGFTLDTTWHVGPHRAEGAGGVRWSGKEPAAVIDFTVPGVKVTEVRGAEVAGWWAGPGGRVQVWLRRPVADGELTWTGTVVLAPAGKPAPDPLTFDAVTPRVADGREVGDTVRVRSMAGWAARAERDRGWAAVETAGGGPVWRANVPAAPPVRVSLVPTREPLRTQDLGWLGPSAVAPRPSPATAGDPPVPLQRPAAPAPEPSPDPPPAWVWPVSAAIGWGVAAVALGLLLVRFPHTTWPEQFGLVGGLFGVSVVGHWWLGLAAWALARGAWWVMKARV